MLIERLGWNIPTDGAVGWVYDVFLNMRWRVGEAGVALRLRLHTVCL